MDNMTFSWPKRSKVPPAVLSGRSFRAEADGAVPGWVVGLRGQLWGIGQRYAS
jgi:hypothetical protein